MNAPEKALAFCRSSLTNRDQFWTEQAKRIYWHRSFDQVCDFSRPPFARWFVGAILAAAEGRDTGDLTTLEDPVVLESIREGLARSKRQEARSRK